MRIPRTVTPALERRYNEARELAARRSLNYLVLANSAFKSFEALIQDSLTTGYRPTMRSDPENYSFAEMNRAAELERLADEYDRVMAEAGSDIRAYRGNSLVIPRPTSRTAWDHISG